MQKNNMGIIGNDKRAKIRTMCKFFGKIGKISSMIGSGLLTWLWWLSPAL